MSQWYSGGDGGGGEEGFRRLLFVAGSSGGGGGGTNAWPATIGASKITMVGQWKVHYGLSSTQEEREITRNQKSLRSCGTSANIF
ncbi:hypothetical protein C5167_025689 [Papaver somniferum]|uniref:Uncharacterized protein n=1 Tax=Papaver somniferum TaxID=3469 RepID=A0A4Y7JW04_PAPSO|nr:hypothetical protein C5167_025689 [Papaver somniferum]